MAYDAASPLTATRMCKVRKANATPYGQLLAALGSNEGPMKQRHSSSHLADHLLALATAVALPLLALIWLLQPGSSLPLRNSSAQMHDALSVQWVPVTREPVVPASSQPATMVLPAEDVPDLPTTSTEPTAQADTTPPPAMTTGVASEAAVGLPVESGGSVYDPSKAQAQAISATDRLRSVASPSEDSPARVDPLSLAEHAPLRPSSLYPADRSGTRVEVVIDQSGIAIEVNVIEGSGDAALDASILDAARTWSYEPARADGAAVMSRLQLDVILERGADSDGSGMLD